MSFDRGSLERRRNVPALDGSDSDVLGLCSFPRPLRVSALCGYSAAAEWGMCTRRSTALPGVITGLVQGGLGLHAVVARRGLGKLIGGDQGAELVREAEAVLEKETVKNVAALCRCLAPGFHT